jgi:uncharacterized protein with HEPN domain
LDSGGIAEKIELSDSWIRLNLYKIQWIDMIASRNKTFHTYNEDTANDIYYKILKDYYPAFMAFRENMEAKQKRGD